MDSLLLQKKQQENKYLQEQTQTWKNENQMFEQNENVADVYENRHYSFLEREENKINGFYGSGNEIKKAAEPAVGPDGWEVVQQQRELSKAEKKVVEQEAKLFAEQDKLSTMRQNSFEKEESKKEAKARETMEAKYLNDKLKLIGLQAEADLEKAIDQKERLLIDINKCQAIVDAWTDYAKTLTPGTTKRKKAFKSKEKAQLDRY